MYIEVRKAKSRFKKTQVQLQQSYENGSKNTRHPWEYIKHSSNSIAHEKNSINVPTHAKTQDPLCLRLDFYLWLLYHTETPQCREDSHLSLSLKKSTSNFLYKILCVPPGIFVERVPNDRVEVDVPKCTMENCETKTINLKPRNMCVDDMKTFMIFSLLIFSGSFDLFYSVGLVSNLRITPVQSDQMTVHSRLETCAPIATNPALISQDYMICKTNFQCEIAEDEFNNQQRKCQFRYDASFMPLYVRSNAVDTIENSDGTSFQTDSNNHNEINCTVKIRETKKRSFSSISSALSHPRTNKREAVDIEIPSLIEKEENCFRSLSLQDSSSELSSGEREIEEIYARRGVAFHTRNKVDEQAEHLVSCYDVAAEEIRPSNPMATVFLFIDEERKDYLVKNAEKDFIVNVGKPSSPVSDVTISPMISDTEFDSIADIVQPSVDMATSSEYMLINQDVPSSINCIVLQPTLDDMKFEDS